MTFPVTRCRITLDFENVLEAGIANHSRFARCSLKLLCGGKQWRERDESGAGGFRTHLRKLEGGLRKASFQSFLARTLATEPLAADYTIRRVR
jgi:hypothetical protein